MKLSDREWKPFILEKIFRIESGKRLESYNMTDGRRPFIGATDNGNGITNYVSNINDSLDKNVLGVNYNGNGMAISFYHPYECIFTDDVKRFHLIEAKDNKYVLLFFKVIILQQKPKYNYGYKFNGNRMKRQIILIPVCKSGEPDYKFMEQYMKELEQQKKVEYCNYLKLRLQQLQYKQIEPLSEKQWKAIEIELIFSVVGSSTTSKNRLKKFGNGKNPYVTTQTNDNGQAGYYDYYTEEGNIIAVDSAVVGYSTYQAKNFSASDHVEKLIPKFALSEYTAIFITKVLNNNNASKFSYGYKASQTRLKKSKILLPMNDVDKPDFEYMEQYIKNLLFEKYNNYLAYIEK